MVTNISIRFNPNVLEWWMSVVMLGGESSIITVSTLNMIQYINLTTLCNWKLFQNLSKSKFKRNYTLIEKGYSACRLCSI